MVFRVTLTLNRPRTFLRIALSFAAQTALDLDTAMGADL